MSKQTGWVYTATGMLPATSGEFEVSTMFEGEPVAAWLYFDGERWYGWRGAFDDLVYAWRCKPEPAPRRDK